MPFKCSLVDAKRSLAEMRILHIVTEDSGDMALETNFYFLSVEVRHFDQLGSKKCFTLF